MKYKSLLIFVLSVSSLVHAQGTPCSVTESACQLRRTMAKLWSDHVFWTRLYIKSALDNSADLKATTNRLLKNQDDIGNAVGFYYGAPAGKQLAKLLKEHILIAAEVVKNAQSGNKKEFAAQDAKWHKNADDIATFLNKANPANWGEKEMRDMLYNHLKLTTAEVVARLGKKWDADVKIFDEAYNQILDMGQGLANGIIAQFSDKFKK